MRVCVRSLGSGKGLHHGGVTRWWTVRIDHTSYSMLLKIRSHKK